MDFQFNPAQLSRCQRNALMTVLLIMQSENTNELKITPVEFPNKFKVKLDGDVEILIGWDSKKEAFAGLTTAGLTTPEQLEQDIKDLAKETVQEPEPTPEHGALEVDLPGPETELDLSPVVERAEALAHALVKLSKPLNFEQRIEVWIKFCVVLSKELWK